MFYQYQAIILKTCAYSTNKITILDKIRGRLECIVDTQRLCLGGLIYYNEASYGRYLSIHQVEQIALPSNIAQVDLLFLHHILEVCYFSVTVATDESLLFMSLCLLYKRRDWALLYKKLFLAKLYLLLHMHVKYCSAELENLIHRMIIESIDTVAPQLIDLNMEKELDKWLRACIEKHPYRNHFKTIHFYTRMASL